jgi:hypothetical protein
MRGVPLVMAGAIVALALAAPARAQGKGKGHKSTPPSSTTLPSPTVAAPATAGAVPFAWIDDASVLPPGNIAVSISTLWWQGTDLDEVDVPVVGMALGIADRVQIGASIPRVMSSADPSGVVGGLGTTFVSAKVGVLNSAGSAVKLAVAPTLEIIGDSAIQALAPGESRSRFGVPVSLEIDRGAARVFGSAGYFSGGVWFAGGGVGGQVTPRVSVSASFSRAWTMDAIASVVHDRRDVSVGAGFLVTPRVSVFGSLGQSIATADADGAGRTLSGGILFLLNAVAVK